MESSSASPSTSQLSSHYLIPKIKVNSIKINIQKIFNIGINSSQATPPTASDQTGRREGVDGEVIERGRTKGQTGRQCKLQRGGSECDVREVGSDGGVQEVQGVLPRWTPHRARWWLLLFHLNFNSVLFLIYLLFIHIIYLLFIYIIYLHLFI